MLSISNQWFFLLIHGHVLSHLNYVTYMFQIVFNHSSYVSTWYHGCNTCLFLYITYHMFFFAQIYDQTRTHTDHTQTTTHNLQHTHTEIQTHKNTQRAKEPNNTCSPKERLQMIARQTWNMQWQVHLTPFFCLWSWF